MEALVEARARIDAISAVVEHPATGTKSTWPSSPFSSIGAVPPTPPVSQHRCPSTKSTKTTTPLSVTASDEASPVFRGRFLSVSNSPRGLLDSTRCAGEDIGAGWIDTHAESMERAKARLAELNDLLTAAGSATGVKPDAL